MEPSPSSFLVLSEQSDIDLCHSLANLVGVVLGCPSSSNHLWYHLFHPEELPGTYMTGFMVLYGCSKVRLWPPFIHSCSTPMHISQYNFEIGHSGYRYDCGVELSPEGQFG